MVISWDEKIESINKIEKIKKIIKEIEKYFNIEYLKKSINNYEIRKKKLTEKNKVKKWKI
jgi:cell fate (sporulation/competence/biofilm development) regulator YlbF (YheA/YmcA/DUF963 family)